MAEDKIRVSSESELQNNDILYCKSTPVYGISAKTFDIQIYLSYFD